MTNDEKSSPADDDNASADAAEEESTPQENENVDPDDTEHSEEIAEEGGGGSGDGSDDDDDEEEILSNDDTENEPPPDGHSNENGTSNPEPPPTTKSEEEEEEEESLHQQQQQQKQLEDRAIAEATATADASYVPSPSLLNASTPEPLLQQVDGPSLKDYNGKESVYVARMVPVPLRGRLDVPIHVMAGGSVVEYSITTEGFDIAFGVTAEREEGVTIVTEVDRVNSHQHPVTGKFLVGTVPCALVFTFDNEYSWFREKLISYKVTVKPPSTDNIRSGRRRRAKAALEAVSQDLVEVRSGLERAERQKAEMEEEVERLKNELEEKRKGLEDVTKEEGFLKERVGLRLGQEEMLGRRLKVGWDDEAETENKEEQTDGGDDAHVEEE